VKIKAVTDGLSNTICIGERYLPTDSYDTGTWIADDWSMYTGFQDDLARSTFFDGYQPTHLPAPDTTIKSEFKDTKVSMIVAGAATNVTVEPWREVFGGPHAGGVIVAKCDGSVDLVEYDIDAQVWRRLGHRSDEGADVVIKRRSN
jgi:hypothetical protein